MKAYDNAGTLQGAGLTFTIAANATTFQTGGLIGIPVGVAAGVVLTHNGAFGAISGNITTLNGANGLSFDSAFTVRDPGGAGGDDSSATSGVNSDITSLTALTSILKGGNPFLHSFGTWNTFVGENAGNFTMTGSYNTAAGARTLQSNSTGDNNTASGVTALLFNTTGFQNTATGVGALSYNTSGQNNTATGMLALYSNTTGNSNTATGSGALQANNGFYNTAVGGSALGSNTTGGQNAALGLGALHFNTTGGTNTATGTMALLNNTTGTGNIAVGFSAGSAGTTGNNNIDIGNLGVEGESNTIRIGTPGTHTATYVAGNTSVSGTLSWTGTAAGNISGSAASATTVAGLVCADGQVAKWSGSTWICGANTNTPVYDAGSRALLAGAKTVIGQGTTGPDGTVVVNLTPPAAFSTSSYACSANATGSPGSPPTAITYMSGTQFSVWGFGNMPFRFICIGT